MNFHELYILMGYTSKSKARGFKLQKIQEISEGHVEIVDPDDFLFPAP